MTGEAVTSTVFSSALRRSVTPKPTIMAQKATDRCIVLGGATFCSADSLSTAESKSIEVGLVVQDFQVEKEYSLSNRILRKDKKQMIQIIQYISKSFKNLSVSLLHGSQSSTGAAFIAHESNSCDMEFAFHSTYCMRCLCGIHSAGSC